MEGTKLGPYRIVEQLGAGGMGEVYRARDERLGRDVAVKVLPATVAEDPERLARFEREARALAALSHPNILSIFDFGKEAGLTYAVTELLEGETLRQRLTRERLAWRKAIEVAAAVADGLAAAHGKGIIHRDIKPENVFITSDGRVKVLDFGLARLQPLPAWGEASTALSDPGTAAGTVLGTVGYMAPEQVRGQTADARSDIFTLGCLLYEMLTGKHAFVRETAAETMTAILKDQAPEVSVSGVEVTPELNRIIGHCLEKNPGERFQSASDLSFHLKSLLTGAAAARPARSEDVIVKSDTPSIAVLPFANLSPDPDQEYFCDGMTEEIITALSKIRCLRVISRNSAMTLKGTRKTTREIGELLNVATVLEGSVRKSGNNLRITAQLIDAATDAHLWAECYAGTLDDVFDIQEKVSRAIVEALRIQLSPTESRKMAERPIDNIRAYECYLRARQEILRFTEEGLDRAQKLLQNGLEIAGENALLHAGMGFVYWQRINYGYKHHEFEVLLRQTEEYAAKALQLDPDSCYGHFLLGLVENKRGNEQQAVRLLQRAFAIEPDNPDVLYWLALFLSILGKGTVARPLVEKLLANDPLTALHHFLPGWLDYVDGRLEEGMEKCRRACEADPYGVCAWVYTILLLGNRRLEEASLMIDLLVRKGVASAFVQSVSFVRSAMSVSRDEAIRFATTELLAAARQNEVLPWLVGSGYAFLDEKEEALRWLEHAVSRGFVNYPFLSRFDPFMQNLRGDERFEKLMERVRRIWEEFEA